MTFPVSLIWALGGLLASGLAASVLERGGDGWIADVGLGLGGSLVASSIPRALDVSQEAGLFTMIVVALVGAARVLVVQCPMGRTTAYSRCRGPVRRPWRPVREAHEQA
jgi:uncharacterized membrane protein YeaQ/YmgE (transglycosylase-associated protein family)